VVDLDVNDFVMFQCVIDEMACMWCG